MIPPIVRAAVRQMFAVLPSAMLTQKALVMLYAIGLQESRFEYRYQLGLKPGTKGPARSFWQMERGGGVKGVINHAASRYWMNLACKEANVPFTPEAVWAAIEDNDVLAASAARLLLFTDAAKLPELGDYDSAWACYIRNWRPGKPHRDTWNRLYDEALIAAKEDLP